MTSSGFQRGKRLRRSTRAGAGVCLLAAAVALGPLGSCARRTAGAPDQIRLRIGFASGSLSRTGSLRTLTELLSVESLISVGWDGRPGVRLADSWQWENENRTLSLHLRPGVTFHNDRPLTSAAVAAALRAYKASLDAAIAQKTIGITLGGFEYLQRIETPDETHVVLHLSRPDQFLLSQLGDTPIIDMEDPSIGTGPFKVVSRKPVVQVVQHQGYYRGRPGIDAIEIQPYDTQRSSWTAMMRGDVNMLQSVARESVEFLKGVSDVRTYPAIRPSYMSMFFNLRHPVLGRVEVRRAVTQAINRERIVRDGMRGHGLLADDPIWPYHWAHSAAPSRYSYNPEAARVRLDDASLLVQPRPESDRMPSRFRFTCLFWSEDPQFERTALMMQRDLAEVGVDMVLEPVNAQEMGGRAGKGDFDAFLFQTNAGRSFDRLYAFWHSPDGQAQGLINSGYDGADAALERLRTAQSDPDVRLAVADLQDRLREDAPAVFLSWIETTRAIDSRFTVGEADDPDMFANVWRWRPASADRAVR